MAAPDYWTKGELRTELLIRLGYGGLGAAAGMFVPIANSLLDDAQAALFEIMEDDKRKRTWDDSVGTGQRWVDIPATCDIDNIDGVWVLDNTTWKPLDRGIDADDDSTYSDNQDIPKKYDIRYNASTGYAQIEIWPYSDNTYTIRIEGQMQIGAFAADADLASFGHTEILLYATAFGKSHLGKPDAKIAMDAWTSYVRRKRAKNIGEKRFFRKRPSEVNMKQVLSKPRVV